MRFDISEQSAAGEIDGRRAKRSSGLLLTRLAEAGGLLSYGASIGDMYPNADPISAEHKRAAPGEFPLHQPTKFDLVVNLETAAALGLSIQATLLARTDE
jgi:hypothetical protein